MKKIVFILPLIIFTSLFLGCIHQEQEGAMPNQPEGPMPQNAGQNKEQEEGQEKEGVEQRNDQEEKNSPGKTDQDSTEKDGQNGKSIGAPIFLENLSSGDTIRSPLRIRGEAPGTWFFEASFPVEIITSQGEKLTSGTATTQGEWMTEELVPFEIQLEFSPAKSSKGKVIFRKANPSGLEENAASYKVPVKF